MMHKTQQCKRIKGFTLVETLVAITVLSFVIVGPFTIAEGVLASSYQARDELTATALAQEGMEYVRSVRDGNMIYDIHHAGSLSPFYGFDGSGGTTNCFSTPCVVDPSQTTFTTSILSCSDSTCSNRGALYLSTNGLYNQQQSGTATRFTRKVQFSTINATTTKATVTVSWTGHGSFSVVLTEFFTNWL